MRIVEHLNQKDDALIIAPLPKVCIGLSNISKKTLQFFLHLFLIPETNVDSAHSLSCDQGMKKC